MELLDAAGRRRSPATLPRYHRRRPPRNKGMRYPADPPNVEEIVAVMRAAGYGLSGLRPRALVVLMWRAGLRISETLALAETDLDSRRGAVLVRSGKGGKRRESGWTTGPGNSSRRGSRHAARCPSGRSSASCVGRHADARGLRPACVHSCGM
jgi:integrase